MAKLVLETTDDLVKEVTQLQKEARRKASEYHEKARIEEAKIEAFADALDEIKRYAENDKKQKEKALSINKDKPEHIFKYRSQQIKNMLQTSKSYSDIYKILTVNSSHDIVYWNTNLQNLLTYMVEKEYILQYIGSRISALEVHMEPLDSETLCTYYSWNPNASAC